MKLAKDLIQGKRETLLLRQLTQLKIGYSNKGEEVGAVILWHYGLKDGSNILCLLIFFYSHINEIRILHILNLHSAACQI